MAAHEDHEQKRLQRAQKKTDQAFRTRANSFILKMLRDPEGMSFAWWLLQIGRVGLQPFDGGANALRTAFNCGELNVGQQILARFMELDPASYARLQQETLSEIQSRLTESSVEHPDGADGSYDAPGSDADSSPYSGSADS